MNYFDPYQGQPMPSYITPFVSIAGQYGETPAAPAQQGSAPQMPTQDIYSDTAVVSDAARQSPVLPDMSKLKPAATPRAPGEHSMTQKLLHALIGTSFGIGG